MPGPARLLAVLREHGPAGVAGRALERAGYRRLSFFTRDAVGSPPVEAAPGLEFSLLEEREVAEYATQLRPDLPVAEIRGRLERGETCLIGRFEGRLVHSRWLAGRWAEIGYLGHRFQLAADVVYVYDSFTAADARRTRAALAGPVVETAIARWPETRRMLAAVWPGNAAGEGLGRSLGYRPIGSLAAVRLGDRTLRLVRRVEEGYLGDAHPLR